MTSSCAGLFTFEDKFGIRVEIHLDSVFAAARSGDWMFRETSRRSWTREACWIRERCPTTPTATTDCSFTKPSTPTSRKFCDITTVFNQEHTSSVPKSLLRLTIFFVPKNLLHLFCIKINVKISYQFIWESIFGV